MDGFITRISPFDNPLYALGETFFGRKSSFSLLWTIPQIAEAHVVRRQNIVTDQQITRL